MVWRMQPWVAPWVLKRCHQLILADSDLSIFISCYKFTDPVKVDGLDSRAWHGNRTRVLWLSVYEVTGARPNQVGHADRGQLGSWTNEQHNFSDIIRNLKWLMIPNTVLGLRFDFRCCFLKSMQPKTRKYFFYWTRTVHVSAEVLRLFSVKNGKNELGILIARFYHITLYPVHINFVARCA